MAVKQSDRSNAAENQAKKPDVMDYQSSGDEKYLNFDHSSRFSVNSDFDWLMDKGIKRLLLNIFHWFIWFLLEIIDHIGWGLRIKGRKNLRAVKNTGAVMICNHVHPMDCTFCTLPVAYRRMYFTAEEDNFKVPFIGKLIRALGAVPVCDEPKLLLPLFSAMKKALDKGYLVLMFPEGELVPYCREIRDFKAGAFRMAASSSVPVVPCVVTFRRPKGLWRLFKRKPLMTLNILPPVYPNEQGSKKARALALCERCRAQMADFERQYYSEKTPENGCER